MTCYDCGDPLHRTFANRRDFLRVGVLGGLGLSLGGYLQALDAATQAGSPAPKAESAIFIFLAGGISHIDTFDPKPYAPIEYRGELGIVNTNVDGIQYGGLFPQTAQVADKVAVIRSMTHGEAAHERGTHNMLTGYKPSPAVVYPSMGSVVAHQFGPRNDLPPYICVPNAADTFLGSGYLSSAYGPFSVGGEPHADNFEVRDMNLPEGVDATRMDRRKGLLAAVDKHFSDLEKADSLDAMDSFYQRAYAMISSQTAREAFNIKAEQEEIRNEYGRNYIGQRLLLARRLVEAGARFVTVIEGGWDYHIKIKENMQSHVPPLDQGLAVLIRDLERRGLLEKTLVVMTTEFGRTARLNKDAGRDHWPKVFSMLLAGGGIKGGQVVGSSDAYAQEPKDRPVEPADVAATIFTQLGINPEAKLMSPGNRPIDIARHFELIPEIV
jgi:uncharacterized protein (DUF1501 family)